MQASGELPAKDKGRNSRKNNLVYPLTSCYTYRMNRRKLKMPDESSHFKKYLAMHPGANFNIRDQLRYIDSRSPIHRCNFSKSIGGEGSGRNLYLLGT